MTAITGELRVASFQTASLALVPDALTTMREQHPQLRIYVTHGEPEDTIPKLLARDFDLVLAEDYPGGMTTHPHGTDAELLCTDQLRLASITTPSERGASRTAPARGVSDLTALRDLPWIMEPPGVPSRQWAVALCHEAGFEPDVRFESSDVLLHVRMVEQKHAAALVPDLVWPGASRQCSLPASHPDGPPAASSRSAAAEPAANQP